MPYNGPSLDPYTRLLASLADAVGNARKSMHSATLIMIAGGVLFVAAIVLFLTSIVWIPAMFALTTAWVISNSWALFSRSTRAAWEGLTDWWDRQKARHMSHSGVDHALHEMTREAVTHHSFLRQIFDALPGVDSELALQMFQGSSAPERDRASPSGNLCPPHLVC